MVSPAERAVFEDYEAQVRSTTLRLQPATCYVAHAHVACNVQPIVRDHRRYPSFVTRKLRT